MANSEYFDVSVFFILFRETLEASIIISVLLAFLAQGIGNADGDLAVYRKLVRQVWFGSLLGFSICLVVGGICIDAWYRFGKDVWSASEDIWEGVFCIIAGLIISYMGLAMLRLNKMKGKWRQKIANALAETDGRTTISSFSSKYAMAILPFVTVLRESVEAIVFIGGVTLSASPKAVPLSALAGILCGSAVGYSIYQGGNHMRIQIFLIISTCFLYLVAAGLMSRAVWYFENYNWSQLVGGDVAEVGSGPGSYDIRKSVWHVNCCNPLFDGGWMIFNALFGWQNSGTYGSVLMYNLYWVAVIIAVCLMLYKEKHGHFCVFNKYKTVAADEIDMTLPRSVAGARASEGPEAGAIGPSSSRYNDPNPYGLGSSSSHLLSDVEDNEVGPSSAATSLDVDRESLRSSTDAADDCDPLGISSGTVLSAN
ncbi:iron permease FTR1 family-domain-containing protein [Lipomyces orientalis]|uniref:Iron permease FTR1 family-domain-containing protein n=1 Tax=Lipomyces orientalis TaxID=1233043 RepID=A0ACC3TJU7_9ASCO